MRNPQVAFSDLTMKIVNFDNADFKSKFLSEQTVAQMVGLGLPEKFTDKQSANFAPGYLNRSHELNSKKEKEETEP